MYLYHNDALPISFTQIFQTGNQIHRYSTRYSDFYRPHTCRTNINKNALSSVESRVFVDTISSEEANRAQAFVIRGGARHIKGLGMLVVLLRGVNFRFWTHLRCSGQDAIIFSCEDLV